MAELKPRDRSASVVDFAIAKICDGIRSGAFSAGQRLPQADLVRQFGISRPALREALSRLAADAIIALEQNHGASVRRLDSDDIREIYEMREVLEGLAARRCAQRIGDGDNARRLREFASDMQRAAASPDAYIESNARFHRLVLEMSGHRRAQVLVPKLSLPIIRLIFTRLMGPKDRAHSLAEHNVVVEGILAGEPDWAEVAMRRHIRRSRDALLRAQRALEAGAGRPQPAAPRPRLRRSGRA